MKFPPENSIQRKIIVNIVLTMFTALIIFAIGIISIRVVNVCLVLSKAERDHTVNYWLAYANLEKYIVSGEEKYFIWYKNHLVISYNETRVFSTIYQSLETKSIDEIAREFEAAFPSANYIQCRDLVIVVSLLPSNKIIQSLVENTRKGNIYAQALDDLGTHYKSAKNDEERQEIFQQIIRTNKLMNDETNLFSDSCDRLSEWVVSIVTRILVSLILITAIIITLFIVKMIHPINNLIKASKEMSQGNLDFELTINSKDEVGLLADSFKKMRDSIREKISELETEINERKIAEKALRESEEKYRILIEAADDAIILTDTAFKPILTNEAYYKRLGFERGEEMGTEFSRIHIEDMNRIKEQFPGLFENGKANFEYRVKHRDGHWITCYAISVVIHDEGGNQTGVLSIIRDITEQRQLEEQLRIRESMESIGTLAGGIAHDFNNLLTGIIGNLEMMRMSNNDNLSQDQNEFLNEALQLCLSASRIVNDFQSLSNGVVSIWSSIDIHKVIQEVFSALSKETDREIEKKILFTEDTFLILGNYDQIHQAFLNIGLNAVQAIEAKGVQKGDYISISACEYTKQEGVESEIPDGTFIHITFEDSGSGMPPEVKRRAFEPLFSTKEKSSRKGQGLGLALVYNIVKRYHKGYIDIESEVGVGTKIHIYLPKKEQINPE